MKKYLIVIFILLIGITTGVCGYYFYLTNYSREWKISKIQPRFKKYMTENANLKIEELNKKINDEKYKVFQKDDWPKFREDWISYINMNISKSRTNRPDSSYLHELIGDHSERNNMYTKEQVGKKIVKINKIKSNDEEMIKEGFEKFTSGKAEWFDSIMSFRMSARNEFLYEDYPQIKNIRQKIRALKADSSSYQLKEVGINFRIEGKQVHKVISCVFMDKNGEKIATTEPILFEMPPYQDEYLSGVYAEKISKSRCYTID